MFQRRCWSQKRHVYDIYITHYSKMISKPPKCTLVLRARPKSAFKVVKMLNMRLWDHVGRIRREKLVCAIFWKCIFIHSVMRTRQNITLAMFFFPKFDFQYPPALPKQLFFFGQHDVGQKIKKYKELQLVLPPGAKIMTN